MAAHSTNSWASVFALLPVTNAMERLERTARLRSGARLGVTPGMGPISTGLGAAWISGLAMLGPWLWRKLHRQPEPTPAWSVYLAMHIISAVTERRSWRHAYVTRRSGSAGASGPGADPASAW